MDLATCKLGSLANPMPPPLRPNFFSSSQNFRSYCSSFILLFPLFLFPEMETSWDISSKNGQSCKR